jgi:long-chain fatty acid transport protein
MKFTRVFAFMALAGLASSAYATNGYFAHGNGQKAKGRGGAATATYDDAFAGANNPAAAAFSGDRIDLGLEWFSPIREMSRTDSTGNSSFGTPPLNGSAESESNNFFIPEFGYNKMFNPNLALGVTVYGNGGMNTDYPAATTNCGPGTNLLCGQGSLGVDLMQLIIAPTAAYKIAPNHSIGISPLIGYQRFKAEGLNAFESISSDRGSVTNNGYDDSWGWGVRVGYMGQITPTVTIGAAYASKMDFQEFSKYAGLFAEQGDFDIPENYNLGVAWQATPQIKLALDYQRINYSGVNSVGNPSTNFMTCNPFTAPDATGPGCLGESGGAGFGWSDINVWKLGAEYKYNNQWLFRGGWNHGDNPISSRDVEFNTIAPAVITDHLTLGFTYTVASGNEVTVAYMHGFENDESGPSYFFGGTDNIKMHQDSLGVQYSWKM